MHFQFSSGHYGFSISAYVGQHFPSCHWVDHPRKHGRCHWNFDSIMSTSWDTCTFGFTVAVLDFWLPLTAGSIKTSSTEFMVIENVGIAVEMSLLSWVPAIRYFIRSYSYFILHTLFHIYIRLMACREVSCAQIHNISLQTKKLHSKQCSVVCFPHLQHKG